MKLKIFLFWILAMVLAPILLSIPVVGHWVVLVTVLGPILLGFFYVFMEDDINGNWGRSSQSDILAAKRSGYLSGYHDGRNDSY